MGDSEEEETRSGLFFHSIRIIKEMRQHDKELRESDQLVRSAGDTEYPPWLRPRWTIYENVKGALSSSGGCDFKAVIEQSIRVVEPEAPDLPMPEKGWPLDGVVYDPNGKWSIAWTVHDAQFFGVPQRRSRLVVLCDYGGLSACEVLSLIHPGRECRPLSESVSESLSGDSVESGAAREGTAGGTSESFRETSRTELDDWIEAVNSSARHQQDLIQHDLGVSRCLAPGTHASGPHLTKTLITGKGIEERPFATG